MTGISIKITHLLVSGDRDKLYITNSFEHSDESGYERMNE